MRNLTIVISCIILFIHCNKPDDANGDKVLEGRLSYYDPYGGDGTAKPLGGRSVKLSRMPSDTLNFLYSVKTDADGYFVFNRIHKDSTYALFFEDTIQGTKYVAFESYKGNNENISLQAKPDLNEQAVVFLQTKDNTGQPMKTTICLFNNKTLFDADSCTGSLEQLTTDNFGRYVRYGLLPGTYYLRAKAQAGNVNYSGRTTVTVGDKGLVQSDIVLSPNNFFANGIKITSLDDFNQPLMSTNLCLFNSRTLFNADTCLGSVLQLTTNTNGEASYTNLTPGKYFILARAQFGNLILKGKDSIVVNTAGTSAGTVHLR